MRHHTQRARARTHTHKHTTPQHTTLHHTTPHKTHMLQHTTPPYTIPQHTTHNCSCVPTSALSNRPHLETPKDHSAVILAQLQGSPRQYVHLHCYRNGAALVRGSSDIYLFLMYAKSSGDVTYIFETLPEDDHNMSGA